MLQLPPFKQATPIAILNIEFPSFNGTWRSLVARLLGVQEAVSSNLAVPIFNFNHLRASLWCPFCFADTLESERRNSHYPLDLQ